MSPSNPPSPSSPHQHLSHSPPNPPGDPNLENPQDPQHSPLNVDPQDQHQVEQREENPEQQGTDSSLTLLPSSVDFPAQTTDAPVRSPSGTAPVLSSMPILRRLPSKRKKGKANFKKQQAIEKKYYTLVEKLKPVPFSPAKLLDFSKREKLLKWLGLWDFVQIDFDRNVRVDLVAQLVASYDPKMRCSYVNDHRIQVNRADLGRAFKLQVKKEKAGAGNNVMADGVDLDSGDGLIEEDSIGFIEDFVSIWVLLHEDTWMMPNEVLNWINVIKDGHPEKVDWAGLFWFMVEKELLQGEHLENCYYASHLQYLIKVQREDVFLPVDVDLDVEEKEEEGSVIEGDSKVGGVSGGQEDGDSKVGGADEDPEDGVNEGNSKVRGAYEDQKEGVAVDQQSLGLTLGQGGGDKEEEIEQSGMRSAEMLDVDEENEVEDAEEQKQWILDGRNEVGEHFLQRCNVEGQGMDKFEVAKADNEEVDPEGNEDLADDGYDIDETLEGGEGQTGNLIRRLETQIAYGSQEQHQDHPSMDLLASESDMQHDNVSGPSHYDKSGKREFVLERGLSDQSLNGCNKRLRIDEPWDDEPSGFGACMEKMRQLINRATTMYAAKEQAEQQLGVNQQLLLSELQQRDNVIEHLHKSKYEEIQKRDEEIFRLERELFVMGALVDGYRKALKETQKKFDEYRHRCQLQEEPIYKDAGPGGIMLTAAEMEKERMKQEEDDRLNRLMIEQKAREFEEDCTSQLTEFHDKVQLLDERLEGFENELKRLKESRGSRKGSEAENQVQEEDLECPTKG